MKAATQLNLSLGFGIQILLKLHEHITNPSHRTEVRDRIPQALVLQFDELRQLGRIYTTRAVLSVHQPSCRLPT
jgi:hypothetical protein